VTQNLEMQHLWERRTDQDGGRRAVPGARLLATVWRDVIVQFRNGFYLVSAFFIAIWLGLLSLLPPDVTLDAARIVPAFLLLNLLITTFYFVGALVLLEKAEGTLAGVSVTPLRNVEYLLAKIISLVLLATAESLLILAPVVGLAFAPLPLLAGVMLLGGLYTLLGFIAIVRYDSINEYLLPSVVWVVLLMLPLLDLVDIWPGVWWYAHPVQPALVLIRLAFADAFASNMQLAQQWPRLAYGVVGAFIGCGVSFFWARRVFYRFVTRTAGG